MKKIKYSDIINSSDIGQYYFCSVSWYLQKKGYKPESKSLVDGISKHKKIGEIIDKTNKDLKKTYILDIISILLLISSVLIFIFKVII
jgi:CRISPR/Cas system-associated exonuclease Cas4 (RecB family)